MIKKYKIKKQLTNTQKQGFKENIGHFGSIQQLRVPPDVISEFL